MQHVLESSSLQCKRQLLNEFTLRPPWSKNKVSRHQQRTDSHISDEHLCPYKKALSRTRIIFKIVHKSFASIGKRENESKSYMSVLVVTEIKTNHTKLEPNLLNHKNYNFLACDWFKNVLFSTNSLAKLLSDSLLLESLLLDYLLSDSLISQSHSKM